MPRPDAIVGCPFCRICPHFRRVGYKGRCTKLDVAIKAMVRRPPPCGRPCEDCYMNMCGRSLETQRKLEDW